MAINLPKLRDDLYLLQQLSGKLLSLADGALGGKVIIETIEIPFPQAQKDALIARYQALKAQLVTLVGGLP